MMRVGGTVTGLTSLQNYLFTAKTYSTLSPYKYESGAAGVSYVNGDTSNYSYNVYQTFGVRSVLNLNADIIVTGTGTAADPYVVQ